MARKTSPTAQKPKRAAATAARNSQQRALALVDSQQAAILKQPSVRVYKMWTPAQLRSVLQSAEGGDLFQLGDLCDQMLADERLGELLETLVDSVLGSPLSFETDPKATVGEAPKAIEIGDDWPQGWSEDELALFTQWAQLVGIGFGQHEYWMNVTSGRMVPRFRTWHPRHHVYKDENKLWHKRDAAGNLTPIIAGDGTHVMMTRRGDFRPWANGLWRGLAPWWLLKRYAISDWGVHTEKGSRLVVEADDGVMAQDRKDLADEIFELAKDQVISLPAGFRLSLIELTANTRDIYQAQVDAADMAFAIAILGQNLTSRIDGGSYAASQTHERVENRRVRYVSKRLSHVLYTQSLPWWSQYNFGEDPALVPYPRFCTDPPEDKTAKVASFLTLSQALSTARTAGYTMPPEQIEEEYGVKLVAIEPREPAQPQNDNAQGRDGGGAAGRQSKLAYRDSRAPAAAGTTVARDPSLKADDKDQGAFDAQAYVDMLVDKLGEVSADKLDGFVERLLSAIDQAEDFDAMKQAVLNAFASERDPDELVELAEQAAVLANLAGRLGVKRDM